MTAQLDLCEPEQIDWDNYDPNEGGYKPPPVPVKDGKSVIFYGKVPAKIEKDATRPSDGSKPFRSYTIDPITVEAKGEKHHGYPIRFTRVSLKPFRGKPGNQTVLFLYAAGLSTAKPRNTAEYDKAMDMVASRSPVVGFTADWSAYNKDTGERIDGYENFPPNPDVPGGRLSVIPEGTGYPETEWGKPTGKMLVAKGPLFANLKVKWFKERK